jgi:aminoglycoside phosphotransferase family enzyme/predicted kinase
VAESAHDSAVEPDELRAALERDSGGSPVDVRETHISWVFLAGERAYKLKKPLVLPFLDYGTPARRREMCAEEVRLNRRLAPHLYLGVRATVRTPSGVALADAEDPRAIDYVVEMLRYDENRTLAATLDRGELRQPDMAEVARTLARFHAGCESADGDEYGARGVEGGVDRNVEELLEVTEIRSERQQIRSLARFMSAFVGARWEELEARAARGLIRECHGDLRAEHVVLDTPVSVVDCVEFDVTLRTLDVADDLAFLVMDLAALGGERFGARLVDAYRAAGGDSGDDALLAFFAVHRALVRAKVLLVRAAQHPPASAAHGHASAQARDLLGVAERFAWHARLPLAVVICGVPASGKSHLAAALAESARLPHISSDLVRKQLAGIPPTERAGAEHYGDDFSRATYAELGRRAASAVATDGGALVDGTFRRRLDRAAFADAFADAGPLQFIECVAPARVLADRASKRRRDPARVSDATLEIVMRERDAWEPLDEVPAQRHLALRTDRPVESILADRLALLNERLS